MEQFNVFEAVEGVVSLYLCQTGREDVWWMWHYLGSAVTPDGAMTIEGADDDTVWVVCVETQSASVGDFVLCIELGPRVAPILCNPVCLLLSNGDG